MAGVSFLLGGGWEVGRAIWTRRVGACHPRGFGSMYAPLTKIIKIFKMRFSEMNSLGSKLCVDVCMLLFCSIASFLGLPPVTCSLQEEGEGLVHVNAYRNRQRKGGDQTERTSFSPSKHWSHKEETCTVWDNEGMPELVPSIGDPSLLGRH